MFITRICVIVVCLYVLGGHWAGVLIALTLTGDVQRFIRQFRSDCQVKPPVDGANLENTK